MDRKTLEERKAGLTANRDQIVKDANAQIAGYSAAIGECDFWLKKLDEAEKPAAPAEDSPGAPD